MPSGVAMRYGVAVPCRLGDTAPELYGVEYRIRRDHGR